MHIAVPEHFQQLTAFYQHVIDQTPHMAENCRWIYGLHPSDELIKEYLDIGCMYYMAEEGVLISAAAVTPRQDEDYHGIQWQIHLADDEVNVIHLLCVDPARQHLGLAKAMIREIINMTKLQGKKAVRLDVLCCNLPAIRLYESLGFIRCGKQNWYTCNAGPMDFYLYEYLC